MNDKKRINIFVVLFFVVFLTFCIVSIVRLRIQLNELENAKNEAFIELDKYEYKLSELKYENSLPREEYIIRNLRKNGYRLAEEIVFVLE